MPKENKKQPKKKRKGGWRVALQYILLWPALRNYVMLWFKYKPKKEKEKKEKIVIIED